MFTIHEQYVDYERQFHVIVLRDGKKEHLIQVAIAADACPACGHVIPKDNLDQIDPKALVAAVNESLDASHDSIRKYIEKHGLSVK